ncbi:MAG TPA: hypothetical protein VJL59_03925 [Anaerolineales bacterium]|nr:hypothetical protein [Anaerolineales bacterium]
MNRTTAIIATVATSLLCGCPGLGTCLWGVFFGLSGALGGATYTVNGVVSPMDPTMVIVTSVASICGGIILIAIPAAVGFFTLRNKPAAQ